MKNSNFLYLLTSLQRRDFASSIEGNEFYHKENGFNYGYSICERIATDNYAKEKYPEAKMLSKVNLSIRISQSSVLEYEMKYAERNDSFFKKNISYYSGVLECLEEFKSNIESISTTK